jgi:hypothetical protein
LHRQFLLVAAVGGDVTALAEEADAVDPVPGAQRRSGPR